MAFDLGTPTPTARARRRAAPLLIAIAAAAIVAAVGIGAYAWTRDRTDQPATTVGNAATITIVGKLRLDDASAGWKVNQPCHALSTGFADVAEGAQVTVTNPAGTVVGLGKLGGGVIEVHPVYGDPAKVCSFPIRVTGVPAGLGRYGVEVAHRGVVRFNEVDLAQPITLDLK